MHSRLFGFMPVATHAAGCGPRILSLRLIFADHGFARLLCGCFTIAVVKKAQGLDHARTPSGFLEVG